MTILLSEKYTVAFTFNERNKQLELDLNLLSISDKESFSLGKCKADNIEHIFSIIYKFLAEFDKTSNIDDVDLLDFQKKHWQQYRNNSYHFYDFFNNHKNDFLLFFIEYYSKVFSMEMTLYLQKLNSYEIKRLDDLFNSKIDQEDPFYSDLLEFKSFFYLYKRIQN